MSIINHVIRYFSGERWCTACITKRPLSTFCTNIPPLLLKKIDSVRRSSERGFNPAKETKETPNKLIGRVEKIFSKLPKPLEWLSFVNHDLPLLMDFCEEVRDVSIQHRLNRSQTRALTKKKNWNMRSLKRFLCGPVRSWMNHAYPVTEQNALCPSETKTLTHNLESCTIKTSKSRTDRKSTRLNSSHIPLSRMPSSA